MKGRGGGEGQRGDEEEGWKKIVSGKTREGEKEKEAVGGEKEKKR